MTYHVPPPSVHVCFKWVVHIPDYLGSAGPTEISDLRPLHDIVADELRFADFYACRINQHLCNVRMMQHHADGQGMRKLLVIKQAPAHLGACYRCDQKGMRAMRKTVYTGAKVMHFWAPDGPSELTMCVWFSQLCPRCIKKNDNDSDNCKNNTSEDGNMHVTTN